MRNSPLTILLLESTLEIWGKIVLACFDVSFLLLTESWLIDNYSLSKFNVSKILFYVVLCDNSDTFADFFIYVYMLLGESNKFF